MKKMRDTVCITIMYNLACSEEFSGKNHNYNYITNKLNQVMSSFYVLCESDLMPHQPTAPTFLSIFLNFPDRPVITLKDGRDTLLYRPRPLKDG